jgi:hypothetical protein
MMVVEAKPLAEITHEAIKILYQKLGIVNTVRFLSQFTVGYGNYTEEREALFGHLTLDEVISEIKQSRSKASTSE